MTKAVQIAALNHYVAKGIPRDGAIAVVSVLYYESKLNPGSQGFQPSETAGILNPHGAYGIASWNGPRQKALLDYATIHDKPVAELNTQLDFVLTETANKYPRSWAAVTSGNSYKAIIPVLVDEYENPRDKQREINGALAIGEPLAALPSQPAPTAPEPQPAPPAPPEPFPVPDIPPPIAPVPEPPQGLPSGVADRQAAVLEKLHGILVACEVERASYLEASTSYLDKIDKEITVLETAITDFNKLQAVPVAFSPLSRKSEASDWVAAPQRISHMPVINWQTSLFGSTGIIAAAFGIYSAISSGQPIDATQVATIVSVISIGLGLIRAKDANVTGGTISNVTGQAGAPTSLVDKEAHRR